MTDYQDRCLRLAVLVTLQQLSVLGQAGPARTLCRNPDTTQTLTRGHSHSNRHQAHIMLWIILGYRADHTCRGFGWAPLQL
mgnify:CR=1 FL=1